jgi:D-arabinose 1-dehydrogenase-like Zn-dependent alcohol dehydrogenase
MSIDVVCTHQLAYRVGGAAADALGWANGPDGEVARFFVPGFLPCGECSLCRRGLVGACAAALRPLSRTTAASATTTTPSGHSVAVPARFLAAIDEPPGLPALPDEVALLAGVAAFALHAMAIASLAPGDVAIWLGTGPVTTAGIALCQARDASAFRLEGDAPALLAELSVATSTAVSAHGSRKRLLFITEPSAIAWSEAVKLGEPGAVFVALGPQAPQLPGPLELPADARVLLVSAYHPDFVPEALAALRRPELEPLRQRLAQDSAGDLVVTRL